jgi:hypothetical protein
MQAPEMLESRNIEPKNSICSRKARKERKVKSSSFRISTFTQKETGFSFIKYLNLFAGFASLREIALTGLKELPVRAEECP